VSANADTLPAVVDEQGERADQRVQFIARRVAELHKSLRSYSAPVLFGSAVLAVLITGRLSSLERYITPEYGIGYALGITGGSLMLALLLYPLRKRYRSLQWMGSVRGWFRTHMICGIVGPSLILFHCNFSLGATNSNVALFSMLIVAISGIIGRYFYSRIHHGLYGAKVVLKETKQDAQLARFGIQKVFANVPDLLAMLEDFEGETLKARRGLLSTAFQLLAMPVRIRLVHRSAMGLVHQHLASQQLGQRGRAQMRAGAERFLRVHLDAVRKVAETGFYERLFSMWHVLHLPLFVMLIVTAVFHIIAVHVY
jgi:hypothetical protein